MEQIELLGQTELTSKSTLEYASTTQFASIQVSLIIEKLKEIERFGMHNISGESCRIFLTELITHRKLMDLGKTTEPEKDEEDEIEL